MAQASDYPVSFKFGATSPPYRPDRPHTGEDRKMPLNTPINVGDTVIGHAGTTGKSSGVHVHVQKFRNGYLHPNGQGLGNAMAFPARVIEVGHNAEIGFFVRLLDATGTRWSYFHMARKSNIAVGKVIRAYQPPATPSKGDEAMPIRNTEFIRNMYRFVGGREPNDKEVQAHAKGTPESLLNGFITNGDLATVRLTNRLNVSQSELIAARDELAKTQAIAEARQRAVNEYDAQLTTKQKIIDDMHVAYEAVAMELNELKDKQAGKVQPVQEPAPEAPAPPKKQKQSLLALLIRAYMKRRKKYNHV